MSKEIQSSDELIELYMDYTKSNKVILVGHPCIDEVRSAKEELFSSRYTKDNLGMIDPKDDRWWKVIAEFLGFELSTNFPLPSYAQEHYYFGVFS